MYIDFWRIFTYQDYQVEEPGHQILSSTTYLSLISHNSFIRPRDYVLFVAMSRGMFGVPVVEYKFSVPDSCAEIRRRLNAC